MTVTTSTASIVVFDNPDYGPSRRMLATVHDVASERADIDVERVDVWQCPERSVEHQVITVPTTIILVDGEERQRLCGPRSARCLTRELDRLLAPQPAAGIQTAPVG